MVSSIVQNTFIERERGIAPVPIVIPVVVSDHAGVHFQADYLTGTGSPEPIPDNAVDPHLGAHGNSSLMPQGDSQQEEKHAGQESTNQQSQQEFSVQD
jgi:hypothetical protein